MSAVPRLLAPETSHDIIGSFRPTTPTLNDAVPHETALIATIAAGGAIALTATGLFLLLDFFQDGPISVLAPIGIALFLVLRALDVYGDPSRRLDDESADARQRSRSAAGTGRRPVRRGRLVAGAAAHAVRARPVGRHSQRWSVGRCHHGCRACF